MKESRHIISSISRRLALPIITARYQNSLEPWLQVVSYYSVVSLLENWTIYYWPLVVSFFIFPVMNRPSNETTGHPNPIL